MQKAMVTKPKPVAQQGPVFSKFPEGRRRAARQGQVGSEGRRIRPPGVIR